MSRGLEIGVLQKPIKTISVEIQPKANVFTIARREQSRRDRETGDGN